ncbi:gluconokinase [Ekhidna sp.]|uniref:gluconokinase n=1 Tax=Ekhidna sp. TaxID=2608089 RepID=UPI003C7AEA86
MGVSGCGKTLIGKMLSKALSVPFFDADEFHSEENKTKMSSGIPLSDEDRQPWLEKLNKEARKHTFQGCVIACSALKEKYRRLLIKGIEPNVQWVYLKGDYDTIYSRMNARSDHYMPAEMLQSQFDDLEEPGNAININVSLAPEQIIKDIKQRLK